MSESSPGKRRFARIDRLPSHVFNVTAELKLAARRRGEDIIDMSMGNPDGAPPPHVVAKLVDAAQRPDPIAPDIDFFGELERVEPRQGLRFAGCRIR